MENGRRAPEINWQREFDTTKLNRGAVKRRMKQDRMVYHDAFKIIDAADLNGLVRARVKLVSIAAVEFATHQRTTRDISLEAMARGYHMLPLPLAVMIAGSLTTAELPSNFVVLMHNPIQIAQLKSSVLHPRVLALVQGEREAIVAAPRIDAHHRWDEDRTFMFYEP